MSNVQFIGNKVTFGRHQTFAVRYGWLSKGFQALKRNPSILRSDEAIAELGVGKNMVESIGYWLRAFQLVERDSYKPTTLGEMLFSTYKGCDPYLEDEATIWLLHWLLVTNPEQATAWFWFFNRYHKPEFTSAELATALSDFVSDQVKDVKRPAASTLKSDATLLPRMYTQSKVNRNTPIEEALDSPLSMLGLIHQMTGERGYQSKPAARPSLPIGVLGYAIAELFQAKETEILPIEDLMYSRDSFPAPGAVFRLTEVDLLTKLEKLVDYIPDVFQINETAGIHQLFQLKAVDPILFIEKHYAVNSEEVAA
ncbi:MAG: DUF4007 family protein [Gammaproteobacteria bacterium]|nr:DUF4007 family protein [Gammaproteobacteria bacterium]